jgi:hypothetical protein
MQPAAFRQVYNFILKAMKGDKATADAIFEDYLAGKLSEELLSISRRWVSAASHLRLNRRGNGSPTICRLRPVEGSNIIGRIRTAVIGWDTGVGEIAPFAGGPGLSPWRALTVR